MFDFINSYIESLNQDLYYSLVSLVILLVFYLLRRIFIKYIFYIILKFSKKTPTDFFTNVLLAFEKPLRTLFVIVGFYIALQYFPYADTEGNEYYLMFFHSLIILTITWGLYNLASSSSVFFKKLNRRIDYELDEMLIPFLSRTVQIIILIIGFSIVVQVFGYSINSIVAGLGIGGLAVALAAQDFLGNLFGGVTIITEKRFNIGDWIETPTVEGTVIDINFRSTRVRTFQQAVVVVPNATIAKEAITNWSEMGKRQINFEIALTHETPIEKVELVIAQIRNILKGHPGVHQETIFVTFDSFNTTSLNIFLYFFTKTTVWEEYLLIKEELNYEIIEILHAEEITLAKQTRNLYVKDKEDKSRITN